MGTDETKEEGDVVEKISRDQILWKLLCDRFDCNHCPDFKRRGRRSITRCLQHLEQLKAELTVPEKKPEK